VPDAVVEGVPVKLIEAVTDGDSVVDGVADTVQKDHEI
jgi:hypothetical protein